MHDGNDHPHLSVAFSRTGFLMVDLSRNTVRYEVQNEELGAGPHTVSLEITREGSVVFSESRQATFAKSQPNGEDCPPTCWQSSVDL